LVLKSLERDISAAAMTLAVVAAVDSTTRFVESASFFFEPPLSGQRHLLHLD
jgi:hypothetical protein